MERRERHGQERKADGEKTGHQAPQPAEEVAEGQNPIKTGQEEVRTRASRRAGIRHGQGFSFASRSIPKPYLVSQHSRFGLRSRNQPIKLLGYFCSSHRITAKARVLAGGHNSPETLVKSGNLVILKPLRVESDVPKDVVRDGS